MRTFRVSAGQQQQTDEELIRVYQTASDNAQRDTAFGELFIRYRDRVACWCLKFTHDRDAAHDLAQDVFLRAFRGLHAFRGGSQFSTWIYVVARNHCRNVVERRANEPACVDPDSATDLPDPHWMKIYSAIEASHACRARCRAIMEALSSTEADVIMLHYGDDLSLAEVSKVLGLTNKSGAKAYIVSARRKLTGIVGEYRESRGEGRHKALRGVQPCRIGVPPEAYHGPRSVPSTPPAAPPA